MSSRGDVSMNNEYTIRLNLNKNGTKHLDYVIYDQQMGQGKRAKKRAIVWVNDADQTSRTNYVFIHDIVAFFKNIIKNDEVVRTNLIMNFVSSKERYRFQGIINDQIKGVDLNCLKDMGIDMMIAKIMKEYMTEKDVKKFIDMENELTHETKNKRKV